MPSRGRNTGRDSHQNREWRPRQQLGHVPDLLLPEEMPRSPSASEPAGTPTGSLAAAGYHRPMVRQAWADARSDDECEGLWPRTPSSGCRSPSPTPCDAPSVPFPGIPIYAPMLLPSCAVSSLFGAGAMPPPLLAAPGAGGNAEMQWITEVQFMAAKLQSLAATVPQSLRPHSHSTEVTTDASMSDLEDWQATAKQLEVLQTEANSLDNEAVVIEEAEQAHRDCLLAEAEASQLAEQLRSGEEAEQQARIQEHRAAAAALAEAARKAAEACSAAIAAEEASRRRAAKEADSIEKLRSRLAKEAKAANAAQQKAIDARVARDNAKDLPGLRKRQSAAKARVRNLKEECEQVSQQIESVKAETDQSMQSGNGQRAEILEARVVQLENECRFISEEVSGGSSSSCSGKGAPVDVEKELAIAQDCNRHLVAELREARSSRDKAQDELTEAAKDREALQSRCRNNYLELQDIHLQLVDHSFRRASVLHEVEEKHAQILALEQKAREVEDEAKLHQFKHQEAWAQTQGLRTLRQRCDQHSTLLEYRLHCALQQLEKVKPGAPLSRCLATARPREKLLYSYRTRRDLRAGSDAGSESVDADVSTTAGESTIECLTDLGRIHD